MKYHYEGVIYDDKNDFLRVVCKQQLTTGSKFSANDTREYVLNPAFSPNEMAKFILYNVFFPHCYAVSLDEIRKIVCELAVDISWTDAYCGPEND
jgi:hypothetical protein